MEERTVHMQPESQDGQPREIVVKLQLEDKVNKFEEYKLFIEDTARLSERRQMVTNTYITINGAIVGLVTFMLRDAGFKDLRLLVAVLPPILAGAVVCYFWYSLLSSYRRLVGLRFKELQRMEEGEGLQDCHRMYNKEADEFYNKAPAQQQISLSKIEMRLPLLFALLYAVILLLAFAIAIRLV